MVLSRLRLIPQEQRFFELFNRSAENVLEGAQALLDLMEHYEEVDRRARRLKDIEHTGDEITHEIFNALNRTFVTPFDRDDIAQLAEALDDVLDWTEDVSRRMRMYKIGEPTELARRLARVICDQAEIINRTVPLLHNLKDSRQIEKGAVELHRLENEADDLLVEALGGLFDLAADVPSLVLCMRWNDLYQILEGATDKAEDVADALQNIVAKHA